MYDTLARVCSASRIVRRRLVATASLVRFCQIHVRHLCYELCLHSKHLLRRVRRFFPSRHQFHPFLAPQNDSRPYARRAALIPVRSEINRVTSSIVSTTRVSLRRTSCITLKLLFVSFSLFLDIVFRQFGPVRYIEDVTPSRYIGEISIATMRYETIM